MDGAKYLNKLVMVNKYMEELSLLPRDVKLSQTEFRMIREIVIEKELGRQIISSELARRLMITRSAISQLVTKLEQRGIIKRVASPTDKKIFYIELSDSAEAVFRKQWEAATEFIGRVVEEFGVDKTEKLIASCEEFGRTLERVEKDYEENKR